uniref:Uncharacterized protein n=1 Tax=Tetranychus urticae TaxID=32264 RepID=T1L3G3_TETUR
MFNVKSSICLANQLERLNTWVIKITQKANLDSISEPLKTLNLFKESLTLLRTKAKYL